MFALGVNPVDKIPLPFHPHFAGTRFGTGIVAPT